MVMTRRKLINAASRIGGAAAVYEALAAWELIKAPPALAQTPPIAPDSGQGKRVAILGAGVSGLCAAYELDRAGYDCVVLEASQRAGGRSLTLRRGDSFREVDGPTQTCRFDAGLWLNAGPGRIPHHHVHVIDYCRKFGVALQPYIFANRANLVHSRTLGNGRSLQVRRAYYDLKGHVAELLDKCVVKPDMDLPIPRAELETFRDLLAKFGDLTRTENDGKITYTYENRYSHAGFATPPGLAPQAGVPLSPMALDEILRSRVWDDFIFREDDIAWQATLMEPAGGMDNFFKGFLRQGSRRRRGTIGSLVRLGARVTAIDVQSGGVKIAYEVDGKPRTLNADFCISTIPVPIFKTLQTNLPDTYMAAARALPVQAAAKVGWQAKRFWETRESIYGGISWTDDDITQIWYPSSGFLSEKGTLTGAYMYGEVADRFNARPVAERLAIAIQQGEKLHDGFSQFVEHGIAIGWNNMEFERFAWADESDPGYKAPAEILARPQGRFVMAGDQLTFWSGWQEGALISALAAVQEIDRQAGTAGLRR